MADIAALVSFTAGTTAVAADVNANFTEIRNRVNADFLQKNKASQTVSVAVTFSAAQTFSAGIAVTGNSTITGTLTALTGITSSGTAAFATVTASATITAGTGLTVTAGNLLVSAGVAVPTRVDDGNSGTSKTIDLSTANIHKLTMTGNCTLTLSNPVGPATYVLELIQDATGSRTMTWPSTVKWDAGTAPTLTTTAARKDIVILYYNGTNYDAVVYGLGFVDTA